MDFDEFYEFFSKKVEAWVTARAPSMPGIERDSFNSLIHVDGGDFLRPFYDFLRSHVHPNEEDVKRCADIYCAGLLPAYNAGAGLTEKVKRE